MANPWMIHLAKVRKSNPGKSLKQCMMIAKKSYKKKGGSVKVGGNLFGTIAKFQRAKKRKIQ